MKVAQDLEKLNLPVHVARVDCTKFDSMSSTFSIRGYPTIKYISHDKEVEFLGERSIEELIDFAKRMAGPKIRTIHHCSQVSQLLNEIPTYMAYFGKSVSKSFQSAADTYHVSNWFFHSPRICSPQFKEGFYSVKGSPDHVYAVRFNDTDHEHSPTDEEVVPEESKLTEEEAKEITEGAKEEEKVDMDPKVEEFMTKYRYPQFVKMTINNMNSILHSNNVLVIALVDEFEPNKKLYTELDQKYKSTMESVAMENFDENVIYGWTSGWDMIGTLTMYSVKSIPSVIVIDSSLKWHIWSPAESAKGTADEVTKEDILGLIQQFKSGTLPMYGGNDLWTRTKRRSMDAIYNLYNMYQGNPVLTLLMFGLPFMFLSFILYSACCTDFMDGAEPEEEIEDGKIDPW